MSVPYGSQARCIQRCLMRWIFTPPIDLWSLQLLHFRERRPAGLWDGQIAWRPTRSGRYVCASVSHHPFCIVNILSLFLIFAHNASHSVSLSLLSICHRSVSPKAKSLFTSSSSSKARQSYTREAKHPHSRTLLRVIGILCRLKFSSFANYFHTLYYCSKSCVLLISDELDFLLRTKFKF